MSQGDNKRSNSERRRHEDRRLDGDRRVSDAGAPERRGTEDDRRKVDNGPPDRRLQQDRRDAEKGPPPGWKDRRRIPERRTPEVTEIPFEQWVRKRAAYSGASDGSGSAGTAKDAPTGDADEAEPRERTRVGK